MFEEREAHSRCGMRVPYVRRAGGLEDEGSWLGYLPQGTLINDLGSGHCLTWEKK